MDQKKNRPDGTTVDLGDDLLEATRLPVGQNKVAPNQVPDVIESIPDSEKNPEASESSDEKLMRAEILIGERLFEDAKKILRQMLKADPNSAIVKEKLLEIQKGEIQELLVDGGRKKLTVEKSEQKVESSDEVLERLERDLRLNISGGVKPVPTLFATPVAYEKYCNRVVAEVIRLPVRNRIDLGIAHLEMGLFEVAVAVFETVVRYEDQKLEGTYLMCLALIFGGRAIEATIRLEPLVRDLTMPEDDKTDFMYLMALAFEKLGDIRKAKEFYRRAYTLNPRYRDVAEKLNELK